MCQAVFSGGPSGVSAFAAELVIPNSGPRAVQAQFAEAPESKCQTAHGVAMTARADERTGRQQRRCCQPYFSPTVQ